MSTLNEFISAVKSNGLMPTNRYKVTFIPPVAATGNVELMTVMMYCEATTLPGVNISTTQARSYGELREIPYEKLFDNITLTFLVDTGMEVKYIFDDWIAAIQNPHTRQMGWYDNYITDLNITVQDKDDNDAYSITLYECYPKSISPITLDYNSKDIMKLQVSMNYKYWMPDVLESEEAEQVIPSPTVEDLDPGMPDLDYPEL